MELKQFSSSIDIIADNFGFKIENKQWVTMLFNMAKNFTSEDLQYGFHELCRITGEEWNKKYGYRGKPPIADWVAYFQKRKVDDENNKRIEEAERKVKEADKLEQQKLLDESKKVIVSPDKIQALISQLGKKNYQLNLKQNE